MRRVIVFDIDDTLYKEIEYLQTAYHLIAKDLWGDAWSVHYAQMLVDFHAGENVFEKICLQRPEVELDWLLNKYRFGVHTLTLEDDVHDALTILKNDGALLGVISDGRLVTQMNKVNALGLTRWIDEDCIVINSEQKSFKPNSSGYERLIKSIAAKTLEKELDYTYVGDNPKKDFIYPNSIGWNTVCLMDDGRNIHKQDLDSMPINSLPDKMIKSLMELI